MRASTILSIAATIFVLAAIVTAGPATAGDRENPNGYGLYSPDEPRLGTYRYDPRSWYYRQPGYYPYYGSRYWVPRADMRYRYRYVYNGPKYRYHPAWGYPRYGYNEGRSHRWGW